MNPGTLWRLLAYSCRKVLPTFDVIIRSATPADAAVWQSLRTALWPDGGEDHGPEIAQFFAGQHFKDLTAVFIAEDGAGTILGYAELSIREDVPGLESIRTGYVEGLYVKPEFRFRGVARKLLQFSRRWFREQGCTACASDRAERIVVDRGFAGMSGDDE